MIENVDCMPDFDKRIKGNNILELRICSVPFSTERGFD